MRSRRVTMRKEVCERIRIEQILRGPVRQSAAREGIRRVLETQCECSKTSSGGTSDDEHLCVFQQMAL